MSELGRVMSRGSSAIASTHNTGKSTIAVSNMSIVWAAMSPGRVEGPLGLVSAVSMASALGKAVSVSLSIRSLRGLCNAVVDEGDDQQNKEDDNTESRCHPV